MNSLSKYYSKTTYNKKSCVSSYKSQSTDPTSTCVTDKIHLKCGYMLTNFINLPLEQGAISAPVTVASISVNTSCLHDSKIKLDFTLNIAIPEVISSANITFQVFKICTNDSQRTPVGSQLSYVNRFTGGTTDIFTFFVYDCDICESKRCIYTVDATLSA